MNYYPQYGNANQYFPNNYYQPQQLFQQQPQPQSMIYGKVVDGIETCKGCEVPIGSYGIFPKGDRSEIYLKSWNGDGTTSLVTYVPIIQEDDSNKDIYMNALNNIQNSILELKNSIKPTTTYPISRNKKKEVVEDE